MRILLDANILLDCLVLESNGLPRTGKSASDELLGRCDTGQHHGLVAWHTLPIIAYYFGKQHNAEDTGNMMDSLMAMLEVPPVGHQQALGWRSHGLADFEDALQVASAVAALADVIITRNLQDFRGIPIPCMTPEVFLTTFP